MSALITKNRQPARTSDLLRALDGIALDAAAYGPATRDFLLPRLRAAIIALGGAAPARPYRTCGARHTYEVAMDGAPFICPRCGNTGGSQWPTAAERELYLAGRLREDPSFTYGT